MHRLHDRKKEVRIYDYADLNESMLSRMFDRRCKGYESIGYSIELPASAVPGWPADVPLPTDAEWKRDYATSIRRLTRDGVDSSLANMFVYATNSIKPGASGEDRARSASERFLYRRMQSMPALAEKFCLNATIPIQFNGFGKMEVDLLCSESKLVIELDGPHHFEDLDAYRRDRRKDALLQEHGYFVLRFLSEDIEKRLDHVLDTIFRILSVRNR